jgi:two-component system, cell cycle response regulator
MENEKLKILVVDDDEASLKLIAEALSYEGYVVATAADGHAAKQSVSLERPHLVLLDINMPGINGIETLKHIRSLKGDYTAVIFVSGNSETESVVTGLDAGADDYICKPFDVYDMLARVRAQLRIKTLHDQLSAANKRLTELVEIDDLTGLYNMRSVYSRIEKEIYRAQRFNRTVATIMLDMDYFKSVNDSHDHLFGSYVLSEIGQIIRENIRKIDFGARYGGDEFLIFLSEIDSIGAIKFVERLQSEIRAKNFTKDGYSMKLTSSMGVAIAQPGKNGIDAKQLVRAADHQLYAAKEAGRNQYKSIDLTPNNVSKIDPQTLRKKKTKAS